MRIAILGKRHSIHAVRWVNALAERGHEVHLLSSIHKGEPLRREVRFHPLPIPPPLGFLANVASLRRRLRLIEPDILSTHFASGYGTLARLSGFRPNVLSVWGSDVYEFPFKSRLHRRLLEANLRAADVICSTSEAMARQTKSIWAAKRLRVVPFGIDTETFVPQRRQAPEATITIGTVKSLARKYGVDVLLRAFGELRRGLLRENATIAERLRLVIVGGGPAELELKRMTSRLELEDVTQFVGPVRHKDVPRYLAGLDVYVALSRHESFGVAVLEAGACELPVVVSDVGGLPEVVLREETGFVVPRDDPAAAATALARLVLDERLRRKMGGSARRHVVANYAWPKSVELMETVYRQALDSRR